MYLNVIIGLIMAMASLNQAPPSPPNLWVLLPLTGAVMALVAMAGLALSAYILWRRADLTTNEPLFMRRVSLLGRAYRLLVLAAYATLLYGVGWANFAVAAAGPDGWALPAIAVAVSPLVALLGISWVAVYWADRSLRAAQFERLGTVVAAREWTLPRYLWFMLRQYLLVILVPLLVLVGAEDVLATLFGPAENEPLSALVSLCGLAGAVLLAGPWIRICWRTEPLPDGDLRNRLLAVADRAGVRIGNILIWRTNLSLANGCMIGMVGPLRYILMTDVLLLSMTPEELEAVFAHEVAHVKYRHTLLFMLVAMGLTGASFLAGIGMDALVPAEESMDVPLLDFTVLQSDLVAAGMAAVMLGGLWFLFGFLSRRCEQEADLYAARATTCPSGCSSPDVGWFAQVPEVAPGEAAVSASGDPAAFPSAGAFCSHRVAAFCGALQRIARLNGSAETRRGWRHFSIARRCHTLAALLADPPSLVRMQRRIARLKTAAVLAALALMLAAGVASMALVPSEPDNPEHPAGPYHIDPKEPTWWVRLVDRNEMDMVALRPPEFDREADAVAEFDDGRLAGLRLNIAAAHDDVAVEDARGHAVAVDAQGDGAGGHG
jgi:STE24 endopeptidase